MFTFRARAPDTPVDWLALTTGFSTRVSPAVAAATPVGATFVDPPADGNCGLYVAAAIVHAHTGVSYSARALRAVFVAAWRTDVFARLVRNEIRALGYAEHESARFLEDASCDGEFTSYTLLAQATSFLIHALADKHVRVRVLGVSVSDNGDDGDVSAAAAADDVGGDDDDYDDTYAYAVAEPRRRAQCDLVELHVASYAADAVPARADIVFNEQSQHFQLLRAP